MPAILPWRGPRPVASPIWGQFRPAQAFCNTGSFDSGVRRIRACWNSVWQCDSASYESIEDNVVMPSPGTREALDSGIRFWSIRLTMVMICTILSMMPNTEKWFLV